MQNKEDDLDYTTKRMDYADGRYGLFSDKDGKRNGPWRTYFKNGKPHIDRTFVNDREHGCSRTWNESGQLLEEKFYMHDQLHGTWKKWDENEMLIHSSEFEFGDPIGNEVNLTGELEIQLDQYRKISPEESELRHEELIIELAQYSSTIVEADVDDSLQLTSRMGMVTHIGTNETWPEVDGQPMVPLLQIITDELPVRPSFLSDVAVISIFGPHEYPLADGINELEVRSYNKDETLIPIMAPDSCTSQSSSSNHMSLREEKDRS